MRLQKNSTWASRESNPQLRGEIPANNLLRCCREPGNLLLIFDKNNTCYPEYYPEENIQHGEHGESSK